MFSALSLNPKSKKYPRHAIFRSETASMTIADRIAFQMGSASAAG